MRKVMGFKSRKMVLELLEWIINWRMKTYNMTDPVQVQYQWIDLHFSIVYQYVSLIDRECDYWELPSTKLLYDTLWNTTRQPKSSINYAKVAASLTQELQEFFVVPRLDEHAEHRGIKKYQAAEVFISFLIQLLCNKSDSIDPLIKDQIDNLEKDLRFLRTVLGDTLLQLYDVNEQVNHLLKEIEAVADEAGSLVHSLLFSTDPVFEEMDEDFGVVLNHIDLLKADIMKFSYRLPLIFSGSATTPKTSVLDSPLIVDSLLHDLEALIKREDNPIAADVKDKIIMLHQVLISLQSCINDIGAPQHLENIELREIFMRIGDMACEAEHLIISFWIGDAPPEYLTIRLTDIVHKMEAIVTKLQETKKKWEIGALQVAKHIDAQSYRLHAKRSFEVDFVTVGLEDKEIHILDKLLGGGANNLQIICIIGMPGLGKTTLAKKLYNHPLVSYRFDRCSFCVISQSYQKKSALLDIIDHPSSEMSSMGEASLLEHLYKILKGRRYLIVMDDIWDSNVWDDLKHCFPDDKNGSRILITSRDRDVSPPNSIIYELPSLTDEECWDLLEKKVFQNETCPHELEGIGRKIAADCCGVPLAVVAIAATLSTMDKEESKWKNVRENLASFIFDDGDDTVMQILELSYKHLPEHLKRCFLYFEAFSDRKEIPVKELLRLWIAEGFIIMREEQSKSAETVAEEYLMELIVKNLAIISKRRSDGGVRACIVHDLLRDLCSRKCEEENFLKCDRRISVQTGYPKFQRLRVSGSPSIFLFRQNLRSFRHYCNLSFVFASNMKLLRVLSFNKRSLNRGEYIGIQFLVCLKYLCTTKLAASISCLVNLEILVVDPLESGVVIPSVILKMRKLRYLEVSRAAMYDGDSENKSQTNNLEFLSTVNIFSLSDEEMLKSSPHLRKLKCNCDALWVLDKETYRYPDLRFLIQLESLKMKVRHKWSAGEINFPLNIKKLTLRSLNLPWEKIMTAGGRLPKLEVLKLDFCGQFDDTWETRDGEFQRLRFLKLENMYMARWNVDSEHFPRLEQLILVNCPLLQKLPNEIGEIAAIQLIEVRGSCKESLVESAKNIQQEQRELGNEELRVIFKNITSYSQ